MSNLAVSAVALCLVLTAAGRTAGVGVEFNDTGRTAAESVAVRLVGGSDPRRGRLEVYSGGSWGAVCSDRFSDAAVRFVCYMLGYGHIGRFVGELRHGGSNDGGPIWLNNLRCSGTETSLADCRRDGRRRSCPDSETVSVSCVPDSTEAVALVGGGSRRAGRLELFHDTRWGTVCDDGFTDAAARVVCYSLGFGRHGRKVDVGRYGAGDGLIWLSNVVCDGTEQHIGECSPAGGWRNTHNCTHRRDVAVSCTWATPVRLVGGSSSSGLVEVLRRGVWGTVCGGDNFTDTTASVVCRMLGFASGSATDARNYTAGGGDGPIWLDGVLCGGTEADIARCSHRGWGVHNCTHRDDVVAVSCVQRGSSEVQVRLNGGRDPRAGRLEVLYDGVWNSVCRDGFDGAAATVVCSMLGHGRIGRPTSNNFGHGPGPSGLQSVQCSGTERSFAECAQRRDWSLGNCFDADEQAAVSCLTDGAVALFGSGHAREGRLEVYHNGSWGTVCDDGFGYAEARVVCHSLGFGYVGGWKSAEDYGVGTGTIWLDDVQCGGTESHLGDCSHAKWGVHDCTDYEDVAVLCFDNITEPTSSDGCCEHLLAIYWSTYFGSIVLFVVSSILLVWWCGKRNTEEARTNPEPALPAIISDANAVPLELRTHRS